ncbi:MAG: hypothetical protein Q9180_007811 [Flavoplaca navasiana]
MGLEGSTHGTQRKNNNTNSTVNNGRDTEGRGTKRKFELDEEQILQNAKDERAKARKAIDEEKSSKTTLPSFWVPALTPSTTTTTNKPTPTAKLSPLCPGSSPSSTHPLSLKTLITLNFSRPDSNSSTSASRSTTKGSFAISHGKTPNPTNNNHDPEGTKIHCPACTKTLTNASKALLAIPCGHVLCKPCGTKFMTPKPKDPYPDPSNRSSNNDDEKAICYICEIDLTPSAAGKKGKEKVSKEQRGVVELRTEGTGFAGGGKNMAKREGVAFQC